MVTVLLVILGFFAGFLGALTGIGGGVLLTPILALHFGIPIRQAIGASLVAVITTSAASSSVHLQRHTTDIRLGMTLELATAFGAAVTAYLVGYFNRNALEGLFAGFLLYSAITILSKRGKVKPLEDESVLIVDETVIPPYEPKRYPLGLAASLVAGALNVDRNVAADEQSIDQSGQHDKEATERADAQHPRHDAVELRLPHLAHNHPRSRCRIRWPAR